MYKNISRIYVGNEFCHNLFPSKRMLIDIIKKANNEGLEVTICFTYVRECYIDKIKSIINEIYNWCNENNKKIEIGLYKREAGNNKCPASFNIFLYFMLFFVHFS